MQRLQSSQIVSLPARAEEGRPLLREAKDRTEIVSHTRNENQQVTECVGDEAGKYCEIDRFLVQEEAGSSTGSDARCVSVVQVVLVKAFVACCGE